MRRLIGLACVIAVVSTPVAGCGDRAQPPVRAGGSPRAALPTAYAFDLTSSCGERSLIGSYRVWVTDDEVTRVEPRGGTPRPAHLEDVPTIADLEELIEHVGPEAVVEVERDNDGRLRSVSIDHLPDAIDDEECYTVSDVRTEEPAARVSCGGGAPGWSPSAMARGIESRTPRDEIEAALRRSEEEMGIDGPFLGARTWIVLAEDDDTLTLGTGRWTARGPGDDALVVTYERTDEGLVWTGHGQCLHLAPVLDADRDWVQVTAPPGGLDRSTTDLTVLVMEHQCTGARDPRPFLDEPVVTQSPDRVVISWTSRRGGRGRPAARRARRPGGPPGCPGRSHRPPSDGSSRR